MTKLVAGIDEVGRGCLAGPVFAAAVILDETKPVAGLADSKKLNSNQRLHLNKSIRENAYAWAIGRAEASEIDAINILQASLLAMSRAFSLLSIKPHWVRVDGINFPNIDCSGETVVQGDAKFSEISAASIIAKVARDHEMATLEKLYAGYSFSQHKGYPTKLHLQQINDLGILPLHRKSFKPINTIVKS